MNSTNAMIDTIHVRTMAIHSHVLTDVSKAPKISLKKRNVMSVVVACVEMRVIGHAIDATLCPDLVDLERLDPEAADEAREVEVADRVAPRVFARVAAWESTGVPRRWRGAGAVDLHDPPEV